jgi:hypothetical protein
MVIASKRVPSVTSSVFQDKKSVLSLLGVTVTVFKKQSPSFKFLSR